MHEYQGQGIQYPGTAWIDQQRALEAFCRRGPQTSIEKARSKFAGGIEVHGLQLQCLFQLVDCRFEITATTAHLRAAEKDIKIFLR